MIAPQTADPLDLATLADDLTALRRALHRRPELGFDEHETQATLRVWLEARGFAPGPPLAGTGFAVEIAGGRRRPDGRVPDRHRRAPNPRGVGRRVRLGDPGRDARLRS